MNKSLLGILLSIGVIGLIVFLFIPHTTYALIGSELLTKPWVMSASKEAQERYQLIDSNVLKSKTMLRLTYHLHGTCLLDGDASAIIFDQPIGRTWRYISLSRYGKNCANSEQSVDIPLSDFKGLDVNKQVGTFHVRIWHNKPYTVDITSAVLFNPDTDIVAQTTNFGELLARAIKPKDKPPKKGFPLPSQPQQLLPTVASLATPTASALASPMISPALATATPAPAPVTTNRASWSIQSVSSMKETKDRVCNPRGQEYIQKWVDKAAELGVNYIAVETPYDNPTCGSALNYTANWVSAIRNRQLKVWHRHMPLAFEGIYDTPKNISIDYLKQISDYIKNNAAFFREGDIFTPAPEPQNGGITGVTYCPQNICQFRSTAHFNLWLRNAMDTSEAAFAEIGLGGKIKIGYYGFDGFVAWGDNNPDWDGILEDATVAKMGNITIDHYPEIVGDTMVNDLRELEPQALTIVQNWLQI